MISDKHETISDHMPDTSLHYPETVPPPRVGCCQYSRGFLPSAFLSALALTSNQPPGAQQRASLSANH